MSTPGPETALHRPNASSTHLVHRPTGATAVEYAILLGVIALTIIIAVAAFGDSVSAVLNDSVAALTDVMHRE